MVREIDVRYIGQGHALTLPLFGNVLEDPGYKSRIEREFDDLHLSRYLHNAPKQPKEIVALRLVSIGQMTKAALPKIKEGTASPPGDSESEPREVYLNGSFRRCKIYDRSRLLANNKISGPAVIEERVSTTLLLEGYSASVDAYGHLVISPE